MLLKPLSPGVGIRKDLAVISAELHRSEKPPPVISVASPSLCSYKDIYAKASNDGESPLPFGKVSTLTVKWLHLLSF